MPTVQAGGAPVEWAYAEVPGQSGPDSATLVGADGDQVVVAVSTDEGEILGWSSTGGGPFEAGVPTETGLDFLGMTEVVRIDGHWLTVGSGGLTANGEDLLYANRVFGTEDGRTWSNLNATGLEDPAEHSDLLVTDGGLVAVGSLRTTEDPSFGGFRPAAWTSADGVTWTLVPLPFDGQEGGAFSVVDTGEGLLAAGQVDQRAALWSSTDQGATWSADQPDGLPSSAAFGSIVKRDGVLVLSASNGEGQASLHRSTDAGATWTEAAEPPPLVGAEGAPRLAAGPAGFFASTSTYRASWEDPSRCYADLDLCGQGSVPALYASQDGDSWRRIDLSGLGDDLGELTVAPDGRILSVRPVLAGTGIWTWPAGAELPGEPEPVDPTSVVEVLGDGEVPEVGVTYGAPLYIHCGMDWLYLGGESYRRSDRGPDTETGAGDVPQPGWPVAEQTIFGFATLQDDGTIEYSIADGEVIAAYAPTTARAPGCE